MEKNKEIVSSASYAINGMLILIVVYLHLLSGFGYYDRFLLRIPVEMFGFFMTWFYFKSGGYHANRSVWESVRKEFHRSIIPYLVFLFLGLLVYNGVGIFSKAVWMRALSQILDFGAVSEQAPLWFVLDFFLVKVFATYLLHKMKCHAVVGIALLFALLLQCCSCPPLISRLPLGVFLYSLGFMLRKKQYNVYVFGICVGIYFVSELTMSCVFDYRTNRSSHYILHLLFCICGIISLNNIVVRIKMIRNNPFLQYVGKNAMLIYLLHWFYIKTFGMNFGMPISCLARVILAVGLMFVTIPLFSVLLDRQRMRWIIGKC